MGKLLLSLVVASAIGCGSTTVLETCLKKTAGGSIIHSSGVKDSAVIGKCDRYHRAEVIKGLMGVRVPKKVVVVRNGKPLLVNEVIDGKTTYVEAIATSKKAYLQYIEKGVTDGIE